MSKNLSQSIEAVLFATAQSYSYAELAKLLEVAAEDIAPAAEELKKSLEGRGIVLTSVGDTIGLATHSDFSTLIEKIRKEELSKELTKASAETLAVIAYTPGVSKAQIEFIRGVNVSYSLRALQMRGLVESKGQGRGIGYFPTLELLQHFGVSSIEGLPQYAETKAKIDALLKTEEPQS